MIKCNKIICELENEREENEVGEKKKKKLFFVLFFSSSSGSVEPALDKRAPLGRRHAGLAPRARVGVEDALLDGLVDLLGGLKESLEDEREKERKRRG